MKYNRFYIKFIFILLLCFFPNIVSAAERHTVIDSSSCNGVTEGTPFNSDGIYYSVNSDCVWDMSQDEVDGGGMYRCINDRSLKIWTNIVNTPIGQTGKRIKSYIYLPIRIDAWANSGGGWNSVSGFNTSICPNMKLYYETTLDLGDEYVNSFNNLKNAKISDISFINLNDPYTISRLDAHTLQRLSEYSVQNVRIHSLSNGWDITDSNGKIINKQIKFKTEIDRLYTNSYGGLGFNGTNGYLVQSGARALHYLVPIQITIEYDNEDYEPDPCEETVNGITPQQYAYANGKCCNYYPEACCEDVNYILSIKDSRPEILEFCCIDNYEGIPYGNSAEQGLPLLYTFKHYFYNDYYTKFSNVGEDAICPQCTQEDDYYTYNYNGEIRKSRCCEIGQYRDRYSDKCEVSNKKETDNWKSDLSCSKEPTNINAPYGTGTVAEGTNNSRNISENITFTDYKSLDEMKSDILKSGTGFDYDISVRHQIIKEASTDYNDCSNLNSPSCTTSPEIAKQRAISEINSFLTLTNNEKNAINNTSSKFELVSDDKTEYYVLKSGSPKETENPRENSTTISAAYKSCNYNTYGGLVCYRNRVYFTYVYKKTYTYTYDLTLRNQYIAKQDASLAVDYRQKVERDEKTINTDEKNSYLDGGNKFYTELTTNTGIYDFTIKLKDENNLGVTGKLKNYNNGFTCQYGVVNQIRKNGSFDCGPNGDLPCPDEDGRGFYFRPISLFDPFPNREAGLNWREYYNEETGGYQYITYSDNPANIDKQDKVYSNEPMYSVTLTPSLISDIKRYNREQNRNYGWTNMSSSTYNKLDSISNFISDNSYGITHPNNNDRRDKVGDFSE